MSRLQLALNVTDLDAAIAFYSRLFRAEPHKVRPGYANFAIADPPLKLVLIESTAPGGSVNHLGVEVETVDAVRAASALLAGDGVPTTDDSGVCCFAEQTKVWVSGPDDERWEIYTVTDDEPALTASGGGACCT